MTTKKFPIQKELTKDDVVIVLGDWGAIWYGDKRDNYLLKWWNKKPWTTFIVTGNHENYDVIEKLPTTTKFDGEVYRAADSVFIAKFGNIYNIGGYDCLCIGGAESHDKQFRKEGISWWRQEAITEQDYLYALDNIKKSSYNVDYVFSHTPGILALHMLGYPPTKSDQYVTRLLANVNYTCHYCGHMHIDKLICNDEIIVYNDIIELTDKKTYYWNTREQSYFTI